VTAKIKNHTKGDKIRVFKFQWKKRYHRTKWFTPQKTTLTIDNVVHG
jgi:ribosomal protein L21